MSGFVFAFLDCEFGGLDPELHDITEVALILTDYRLAELSSGEWKIAARAERITDEAAAISGYDAEAWRDAPHVRDVLNEISAMMPAGKVVVPAGQNVRMDVAFLERAYRGCGIPYPFDYHVIDLASLFYVWSLVAGEPVSALSLRQAAINAVHAQLQEFLETGYLRFRRISDIDRFLELLQERMNRVFERIYDSQIPE